MQKSSMLVLLIFLYSCPSRYAPEGLTGGYSSTKIGENQYKVTFRGNGFTSRSQVEQNAYRRAEELCDGYGFESFRLLDQRNFTQQSEGPKSYNCQRTWGTINCREQPGWNFSKTDVSLYIECTEPNPDSVKHVVEYGSEEVAEKWGCAVQDGGDLDEAVSFYSPGATDYYDCYQKQQGSFAVPIITFNKVKSETYYSVYVHVHLNAFADYQHANILYGGKLATGIKVFKIESGHEGDAKFEAYLIPLNEKLFQHHVANGIRFKLVDSRSGKGLGLESSLGASLFSDVYNAYKRYLTETPTTH